MRMAVIHRVDWTLVGDGVEQRADYMSLCGAPWTVASKYWKYTSCKKCLLIWDKNREKAGLPPRRKR